MTQRTPQCNDCPSVDRAPLSASASAVVRTALLCLAAGIVVIATAVYGHAGTDGATPRPKLVRARHGDTPATLAARYLGDATEAWRIGEYNDTFSFSDGQPVLIPTATFRPGGLFPDGYQTVPVLVYDGVGTSDDTSAPITAADFKSHMDWLKTNGFIAIAPDQLAAFMDFSGQLPERAILVTFDGQSRSLLELALPILDELDFRATLFVATDAIGHEDALTWPQLEGIQSRGFSIGCRGRSGRSLLSIQNRAAAKVRFDAVVTELRYAKKTIENHLNRPCTTLAWPGGEANGLLTAMAAKLGFTTAFIRSPGETPFFGDRYHIHRVVVDGKVPTDELAQRLTTRIKTDLR